MKLVIILLLRLYTKCVDALDYIKSIIPYDKEGHEVLHNYRDEDRCHYYDF